MKLAVGDVVVYPGYGAGCVVAREKRVVLGAEQEVVVLELADGLSVTLPMQLAHELLRSLVSEAACAGFRRSSARMARPAGTSG